MSDLVGVDVAGPLEIEFIEGWSSGDFGVAQASLDGAGFAGGDFALDESLDDFVVGSVFADGVGDFVVEVIADPGEVEFFELLGELRGHAWSFGVWGGW